MGQLTVSYITGDRQKPEISPEFRMSSQNITSDGHSLEESSWPLTEINYVRAVNSIVSIIMQLLNARQNSTCQRPELSISYNQDADSFDMNFLLSASKEAFYIQYYNLLDFFTEVEFSDEEDAAYLKTPEPIFSPEHTEGHTDQIEITFKISDLVEFVSRLQQYAHRNNIPMQEKYSSDSARIPADRTHTMVLNQIMDGSERRRDGLYTQALYHMPFATYTSAAHAYLTGLGTSEALRKTGIKDSFARIQGLLANQSGEDTTYPALLPQ